MIHEPQTLGTLCFWSIGLAGGLLPGWVTAVICLIFPSVYSGLHVLLLNGKSFFELDASLCTRVD